MTTHDAAEEPIESARGLNRRRALLGLSGASAAGLLAGVAGSPAAQADAAFNQQVAQAHGFWPVLTDDPPSQTTMYGVPVVWISRRATLQDVPVMPLMPTFDNTNATYTIPDMVGVDYYLGSTMKSPGTYSSAPGQVITITSASRSGYIIPGTFSWRWSFPDPTRTTIVTSDTFSGDGAIAGRTTDVGLGGAPLPWSAFFGSTGAFVAKDGALATAPGPVGDSAIQVTMPDPPANPATPKYSRLEFTISQFDNVGHGAFMIGVAGLPGVFGGVCVSSGVTGTRLMSANGAGGMALHKTAPPFTPGAYSLQYYDKTAVLVTPTATYTADLAVTLANGAASTYGQTAWFRAATTATTVVKVDNVVLRQVGW